MNIRKREEKLQNLENDVRAIYRELHQAYYGDDGIVRLYASEHHDDPKVTIESYSQYTDYTIRIMHLQNSNTYYMDKLVRDKKGRLNIVQRHNAKTLRGVKGYIERIDIKPYYRA